MTTESVRPLPLPGQASMEHSAFDAEFELTVGLTEVIRHLPIDGEVNPDKVLSALLTRCVDAVAGAQYASLTERTGATKPPVTVAATEQLAYDTDLLQYGTNQGPCVEALTSVDLIQVDDLTAETRWPHFQARAVAATPMRSVLSIPVPVADPGSRSLNLYSEQAFAFDGRQRPTAYLAASAVALTLVALRERRRADHLATALESNRQIGAAMGVVMATMKCTLDDAFMMLRVTSQNTHRKLRDVADEVLFTGVLPAVPAARGRSAASASAPVSPLAEAQRCRV